jgi:hypothetical protein
MITRNDTILLLTELQEQGIDTGKLVEVALRSSEVNMTVIKFINSHRPFEANKFYEKIRKSYNDKKSTLYRNIVKENLDDPNDVLTTLASLNLQILLYSKNVDDKQMFLRHMRFEEICAALLNYSKKYDLVPCIKLLQRIKADLKAFQYFNREV